MKRTLLFLLLCVSLAGLSATGCSNPATAPTPTPVPTPTPPTPTPQPTPDPTPAKYSLGGQLTDGTSHGILPGINVVLSGGPTTAPPTKTDGTGRYSFASLLAGTYSLQFSADGYVAQTLSVVVNSNTTQDIVLQRVPPAPTTFTLSGSVVDAATQAPISGAIVRITDGVSNRNKATTTDSSGHYSLGNLVMEADIVEVSATGYTLQAFGETVTGNISRIFQLTKATFTLSGRVTDAVTGLPIAGAEVRMIFGPTIITKTDSGGNYSISGLVPGMTIFEASATGYKSSDYGYVVSGDRVQNFQLSK